MTPSQSIIQALAQRGIMGEESPTGGGCMAIIIPLGVRESGGYTDEINVTNGDAALPDNGSVWAGLYMIDQEPIQLGDWGDFDADTAGLEHPLWDLQAIVDTIADVVKDWD